MDVKCYKEMNFHKLFMKAKIVTKANSQTNREMKMCPLSADK